MPSTNLSFRTPKPLLDKIQLRDAKGVDNPGAVAKREVERWYALLEDGLKDVQITPVEAVVLIYYVAQFEGCTISLWLQETALRGPQFWLSDEFRPAGASLADKIDQWSKASLCAAWDAAERYQVTALKAAKAKDESLTFGMALHRTGLHTYDLSLDEQSLVEAMQAVTADLLPGQYLRALKERDG